MVLKDKFKNLFGQLPGMVVTAALLFGCYHFFVDHHQPAIPDLKVPEGVVTKVGIFTTISGQTKSGSITWKLLSGPAPVTDVTLEEYDQTAVHFVAPVPGDYRVVASTVVKGKAVLTFCTIHVLPYTPGPIPPGPNPNPTPPAPAPNFPDGRYKLSKTAYDLAMSKVTLLSAEQKVASAHAIANSFRSIAGAIAAGTMTDLKLTLVETKKANDTAITNILGELGPAKWDLFGIALQQAIFKLYTDQKLNTVSDLKDCWLEVAQGLEAVK